MFQERIDLAFKRIALEKEQGWDKSNINIPFISFPSDWQIKIMMPTANATIRLVVKLPDGRTKSVYFDDKNALGSMDKPYFEVYPVERDVERFYADEIEGLLAAIQAPGDLKYKN